MLNKLNGSAIVYEPLNLDTAPELIKMGFTWRQHIPASKNWIEARRYFSRIFNGERVGGQLFLERKFLFTFCHTLIYKIIRGKLMLKWFLENFEIHNKPIFLIRHPIAVIESMRQHPSWNYDFSRFIVPECKNPEIYIKNEAFFQSLNTKQEQLLAFWCIGNQEMLNDKVLMKEFIIVFYEDLIAEPKTVVQKIFAEFSIPLPDTIFSELQRPSKSSNQTQEIKFKDQIGKWKKSLSLEELQRYQFILDHFKINIYSSKSLYPDKSIYN